MSDSSLFGFVPLLALTRGQPAKGQKSVVTQSFSSHLAHSLQFLSSHPNKQA